MQTGQKATHSGREAAMLEEQADRRISPTHCFTLKVSLLIQVFYTDRKGRS